LGVHQRELPPASDSFVVHGDRDTVVLVGDARAFVDRLRRSSSNPVVCGELPGAQHTFDLCHSIGFDGVVNAIEAFVAWVRSRDEMTPASLGRQASGRRQGDADDPR
jgi:acetyl esterase/lipase